jgi:tetratricopeptide (TPR) repeat protein
MFMFRAAKIAFFIVIFSSVTFLTRDVDGQTKTAARAAVEDLNRQAVQLINDKKFDPAIQLLSNAIEIDPSAAELHLNLGSAYLLSGRAEIGLGHIKKGIELDPRSYKGYNQLGVAYDNLRRDDLAIEALKKAVELKPDYAFGYFNLGKAYLFTNRWKQAEAALDKGLKLDPSNDDGRLHLAAVYARQERFREAIAFAKAVTKNQPDNATANLVLCKIYILANDRESALGMYQSFKASNVPLAEEMFRSLFSNQILDVSKKVRP